MARIKTSTPHPRTCTGSTMSMEGPSNSTPNQPSQSSQVNENLVTSSPSATEKNLVMPSPSSEIHSNVPNSEIEVNVETEKIDDNGNNKEIENHGKARRSAVWDDFKKETLTDKNGNSKIQATCLHCNHHLSYMPGHGTSHLRRHIDMYCKKNPKGNKDIKQLLLSKSSIEAGGQIKPFKFNQVESRQSLAKFIICAELPFRIVEHPYFVEFSKSLQPLFHCVSRVTVRNDCITLYEVEKKKLQDVLSKLNSRVSFTSDMWTSNQKLGYMTLTAHYIDGDFILRKRILSFKKVPYPHTSYVISDVIWSCIREWELDDKVLALTLDNASSNDSAVSKLKENYGEKLFLHGVHMHIRCCAHILNILVQDGLKVMQNAIDNVRNIVRYVGATPSRMQMFNEIASQKRLPKKKGLVYDVSTRWNSTYDMLANAISYKDAFMIYVQEHGNSSLLLTHDDWKKSELFCKFLKHFVEATKVFSGFKYPTSNLYFKEIWNIRGLLVEEACNFDVTIRNLASEMQRKFDKYWRHCNKFLCIATVLDPRLKLGYISFSYMKEFGEIVGEEMVNEILVLFNDIYDIYEKDAQLANLSNVVCVDSLESSCSKEVVGSKRKHDMDYMVWLSKQQAVKRPKRSEIDIYLAEQSLGLMSDGDFNLLGWWKNNANIYPILARMARDFLAIPISTVSSESAFSTGGRVIDPHRSRLNPDTIEALICTQDWLHQNFNLDEDVLSSLAEELDQDSLEKSNESKERMH
ncbi:zinc finger BED domain-containing protein RICESLEEPER 2 [Iris pallida]|uniref:Zinc finger BED domain-containing protein RICESLEEPER 2 n=1 Tax=Iris pallida TaxID=29817 RepID=A0AAX6ELV9_IRIPA|nr:zinc finger BED domain-containing protein RICESLEEPER 2 [Iris pallida]